MGIATSDNGPVSGSQLTNDSPPSHDCESSPGSHYQVVVIEPTRAVGSVDFHQLWAHRELLYFLIWKDLKVRYKQTALGLTWVLLQPLFMTAVFTLVLGKLIRVPSDGVPYPLFAYAGIMLWTFFASAVQTTGNCLIGNTHLITKVYFPRLILPLASILGRLVDLCVVFAILCLIIPYFGIKPTWHVLLVPVFVILITLLALGVGMWTAALNVKYRDIGLALPVLIQLWMFLSPVAYGLNLVPEKYRLVYSLNPLVGIIEGLRSALFGNPFHWIAISISAVFTVVLLVYATFVFLRREKTFADIL